MQKIYLFITVVILFSSLSLSAQNVGINSDGSNPDASAILDLKSTTSGFLPPRLTTAQRNAIVSPVEGLMIYNTDDTCIQFYDGISWSACLGAVITNQLQCATTSIAGSYDPGTLLDGTNTITIDVVANVIGAYVISTNTLNSYSFYTSGTFLTTGIKTITLLGSGTPAVAQTDNFTISINGSATTCTASITVSNAKRNCLAWFNLGHLVDGIYLIDPDGGGGNAPFNCHCDMTTSGGGWTKIITQADNSIAYLDRFGPTNTTWHAGHTGVVTWNVNNWPISEDYVIDFDFDDVRYSWIPGRYDTGGLGKAIVKTNSTELLYKADSHANNANGQTIRENGVALCTSCTTNYTALRTGIINLGASATQLKVHFTDFTTYFYNNSQVRELWVR